MTDQVNEAVAWTDDAQKWGKALNEASWTFIETCPEKSPLLFNTAKGALRAAILRYAEFVAAVNPALAHPARGVVDEAMVERGIEAAVRWALVDGGYSPDQLGDWRNKITPSELAAFRANTVAILQAAALPAVPEGWVLVPKEPTPEMIATGENSIRADVDPSRKPQRPTAHRAARNAYVSMLAATPKDQPAQGVDSDADEPCPECFQTGCNGECLGD